MIESDRCIVTAWKREVTFLMDMQEKHSRLKHAVWSTIRVVLIVAIVLPIMAQTSSWLLV